MALNEREAKILAIKNTMVEEFWRTPWNFKESAERVLLAIEQVEIDYDQRRMEKNDASRD